MCEVINLLDSPASIVDQIFSHRLLVKYLVQTINIHIEM